MAEVAVSGPLRKMPVRLSDEQVHYQLAVGDERVEINPLIGSHIRLEFLQQINCIHCDRKTNKSFNQGYCYPCFQRLAQCDSCIISPEKCHYFEGTCREPDWADQHCMIDHIVYLANSSNVKVGITRGSQAPTRWIDQGAVQALPIFRVANRLQSGVVEHMFKQYVADKTSWQAMLKAEPEAVNLAEHRDSLVNQCSAEIDEIQQRFGIDAIQPLSGVEEYRINYPVQVYPVKVKSQSFDKQAVVEGELMGIKGQYLMLDSGVINIRKFGGYQVRFSTN